VASSLANRDDDTGTEEDKPSHQSGSSMPVCASGVLDTTLGMQELEDAVAENQWRNSESYGEESFSHSVQIGGATMKKSRAITQQFRYMTSASSTDRLRRVAQESRFKNTGGLRAPHSPSQGGDEHVDIPTLSIHQPIATVVFCEEKLFLCIAEVNGLFLDNRAVDDIPISVLCDKVAQVSYQGLRLLPASYLDDHDGKHDWRSSDLFRLTAKVPGALVMPINPDVTSPNLCDAFFLFQSSELMALAASLLDSIPHGHRKAIPQAKCSEWFLYREQDGKSSCC